MALFAVKAALLAGSALGIPLPSVPAGVDSLLECELTELSALYESVSEAVGEANAALNAQLDAVLQAEHGAAEPSEARSRQVAAVRTATGPLYRDLKALLDSLDAGRQLPLFKTVRGSDGSVGWVCQDHVARWQSS